MKRCPTCLVSLALAVTTWFGYQHLMAVPAVSPTAGTAGAAPDPTIQPAVRDRATATTRDHPELFALRRDVDRLHAELGELRREFDAELASLLAHVAGRPAASRAARVVDDYPSPEQIPELMEAAQYQASALLEERFFQQSLDDQWSSLASEAIFQSLADTGLPTSVGATVDCRATLCRVELIAEEMTVIDQWLPQLAAQVGDLMPGMSTVPLEVGGEPGGVIIYLGRDGYELPGPGD